MDGILLKFLRANIRFNPCFNGFMDKWHFDDGNIHFEKERFNPCLDRKSVV